MPYVVAVIGLGLVAQRFIEKVKDAHVVCAVADRSACVVSMPPHPKELHRAFSPSALELLVKGKKLSRSLASMVDDLRQQLIETHSLKVCTSLHEWLDSLGVGSVIVVDCSASDLTSRLLVTAKRRGFGVVSCNKRPFAGPLALFRSLVCDCGRASGRCVCSSHLVHFETTVGAALPVIVTAHRIRLCQDAHVKTQGVLSGSVAYILNEVGKGVPFSDAVRSAMDAG